MEIKHVDIAYKELVEYIIENGTWKPNRTGSETLSIFGWMVKFDMSDGFPILTTRKIPFKSIKVELEGFIKGITNKNWYKERGCNFWNYWCNPKKVEYKEENKKAMENEPDLGKIYGYQWNNFNSAGYNQIKHVIESLKKDPYNRRLLVNAWNPLELEEMALPPCHFYWYVSVGGDGRLNLAWGQRSVDVACGLPANISSYALLLHLLCKETGYKEGLLVGHLLDVHIYREHLNQLVHQINLHYYNLPKIKTETYRSIYDWCSEDSVLEDYVYNENNIKYKVVV